MWGDVAEVSGRAVLQACIEKTFFFVISQALSSLHILISYLQKMSFRWGTWLKW
jgi:hypothetical protein